MILFITACTCAILIAIGVCTHLILDGQRELREEVIATRIQTSFVARLIAMSTRYRSPEEFLREEAESRL